MCVYVCLSVCNVCVCASECVYFCQHVCHSLCVRSEGKFRCWSLLSMLCETGSLLAAAYPGQLAREHLGNFLSVSHHDTSYWVWIFWGGPRDLNPDSHTCAINALPTELPTQLLLVYFLRQDSAMQLRLSLNVAQVVLELLIFLLGVTGVNHDA